jgi:hypothetical protein
MSEMPRNYIAGPGVAKMSDSFGVCVDMRFFFDGREPQIPSDENESSEVTDMRTACAKAAHAATQMLCGLAPEEVSISVCDETGALLGEVTAVLRAGDVRSVNRRLN